MILVTGASGHVGGHLIDALKKRHEAVRILDMKESAESRGVEMIKGNILDEDAVRRAAEGADVIYHLAAIVDYRPAGTNM